MDGKREGRNISQGNFGTRDSFSPSVYCIWCEVNDHSIQKCLNRQYSFDDKKKQAKKHNACSCCLQTTDHTYDNCPQKRRCHICSPIGPTGHPIYHSHYLHSRAELEKYLKILLDIIGVDLELVKEELLELNDYQIMEEWVNYGIVQMIPFSIH